MKIKVTLMSLQVTWWHRYHPHSK